MIIRGSLFLLVAAVVVAGSASAGDPWLDVEARYWVTDISGKTRASITEGTSFEFDAESDLGLDDENAFEARLTARMPLTNHRFRASYMPIHFEGDRVITKSVTFAGNTYTSGTRVRTDLDIQYGRLGWAWLGLKIPFSDIIKAGPLIEAKGFWTKSTLAASGFSTVDRDFGLALPTVGLIAEANPTDSVNLFAEASGIPAGKYGHFIEAEGGVRYSPIKYFTVLAGYRYFEIKAEKEPDLAQFTITGPFAGGAFRF